MPERPANVLRTIGVILAVVAVVAAVRLAIFVHGALDYL